MKRLSFYMLLAAFLSGLFYSASYPYIYAETVKAVTQGYISFESVFACLGSIVFCGLWNKYSDKLFRGYRIILWLEVLFDVILFADVLIRGDLKFYFVFNIIIYSIITKNLACGGTKMRAIVNPTEKQREWYDNSCNIVCSAATLIGVGMTTILKPNLTMLFVLALCGDIIDYIYKSVYNVSEDGTYHDEVDGFHSPGDCYSPKGHYCGDCGKRTCAHCDFAYLEEEEWEDE